MKSHVKELLNRAKSAMEHKEVVADSERESLLEEISQVLADEKGSPWWVIALKVLAYAIGLILAGYGTTAAAATIIHLI